MEKNYVEKNEAEILQNLGIKILDQSIEVSSSPLRTSVISYNSLREDEQCTYCVYCGKEILGHFNVGTFEQKCTCEKAKVEHEKLLKIQEISKKIQALENEKATLEKEIKDASYKSAIPYILDLREDNAEVIEEALNIYKDVH